ncbi:hypothetical protein RRG08_056166 [Elysia crispata]|uniref:Uncharacterized protein n=1 Tax=Elysia crispata TaxID=231223 RepID=A0AAE1D8K6_9GAST|nr:hypothetical protein RRG08_056166 [Elysia crispata]
MRHVCQAWGECVNKSNTGMPVFAPDHSEEDVVKPSTVSHCQNTAFGASVESRQNPHRNDKESLVIPQFVVRCTLWQKHDLQFSSRVSDWWTDTMIRQHKIRKRRLNTLPHDTMIRQHKIRKRRLNTLPHDTMIRQHKIRKRRLNTLPHDTMIRQHKIRKRRLNTLPHDTMIRQQKIRKRRLNTLPHSLLTGSSRL